MEARLSVNIRNVNNVEHMEIVNTSAEGAIMMMMMMMNPKAQASSHCLWFHGPGRIPFSKQSNCHAYVFKTLYNTTFLHVSKLMISVFIFAARMVDLRST